MRIMSRQKLGFCFHRKRPQALFGATVPLRQVSSMQKFQNCRRSVDFSPADLSFHATKNIDTGGVEKKGGTAWVVAEEEC